MESGTSAANAAIGETADNGRNELTSLFDSVAESFESGASYPAMVRLVEGLADIRERQCEASWVEEAKEVAKRHPVSKYVFDCPFTRHSAAQPRGYPGDAQLIDFIYRHPASGASEQDTTDFGRNLLLHNVDSPAPAAVRARRHLMASYIVDLVSKRGEADIMSVACGHARELELIPAKVARGIRRFVAVDQDASSLAVAGSYRSKGIPVEPVQSTILQLMRAKTLHGFDLIFSAGLYDYLSDRLTQKLTASLFARLKSGGRLILANFLPDIRDAGYMEIFMDWRLIYREEREIRAFAAKIPREHIAATKYFTEPNRNVGFLEITRR